jgi:phage terminase small subunit
MAKRTSAPPAHLSAEMRAWWGAVTIDYDLEDHHRKLLQVAAESWDLAQRARLELEQAGSLTHTDRFGGVRPRPEIAVMRDARTSFMRALRELALDISEPSESRPPMIVGRRTG